MFPTFRWRQHNSSDVSAWSDNVVMCLSDNPVTSASHEYVTIQWDFIHKSPVMSARKVTIQGFQYVMWLSRDVSTSFEDPLKPSLQFTIQRRHYGIQHSSDISRSDDYPVTLAHQVTIQWHKHIKWLSSDISTSIDYPVTLAHQVTIQWH